MSSLPPGLDTCSKERDTTAICVLSDLPHVPLNVRIRLILRCSREVEQDGGLLQRP